MARYDNDLIPKESATFMFGFYLLLETIILMQWNDLPHRYNY